MKKNIFFAVSIYTLLLSCLAFGKSALADTGLYRLYHPGLQIHLYTKDSNEYTVLGRSGWKQEGQAWITSDDQGDIVYRMYNPALRVHLYTKDSNEYNILASRGWKQEGLAFQSHGAIPIYRLYNPSIKRHLYTKDSNEYKVLANRGWKQEGVAFYAEQPSTASSIPAEVVGTWSGTSPLAPEVSVTITADGQMKTYNHFVFGGVDGVDTKTNYTATITELKTIAPNTYFIIGNTGDIAALLPGVTNMGGMFVIQPGFKIENGQYMPIAATGPTIEQVDYQNYHDFGFSLTKQ